MKRGNFIMDVLLPVLIIIVTMIRDKVIISYLESIDGIEVIKLIEVIE